MLVLSPPKVKMKASAEVINPKVCPYCGRKWVPKTLDDKSEECEDCRAYLDNEEDGI